MAIVQEQTPLEFFREQVELALEHQRVSTSAFTEYYLVNLLASSLRGHLLQPAEKGYDETPLALAYVRALGSSRYERALQLRSMGDAALFVSGFFADSLTGKMADLAYYRAMGGQAYFRLSREDRSELGGDVFGELAGRFAAFADVLAEVSESTQIATSRSLLQLYERWLQTRSRRAAALLAERGITPVAPGDGRPQ